MVRGPFRPLISEVKHTLWGHRLQIYNLNFPWQPPVLCASKQHGWGKCVLAVWWDCNLEISLRDQSQEGGREEYGLCKHATSSKDTQHNNLWKVLHLHLYERISHGERRRKCNLLWVYCLCKPRFTWQIQPSSWVINQQKLCKKNTSYSRLNRSWFSTFSKDGI